MLALEIAPLHQGGWQTNNLQSSTGENTVSEVPVQLLTNVQSFQNSISTPEKYLRYNGYCWGRLNMCVPLISSDSKHSGDGNCVKGRVFPLITLLVIWRLLLECSSNLKASQGYFQLIIHTCHLEAEAALSIIANQR